MKLQGKTVLVAGSGRGTGREIALEAARQGANVITNARSVEDAEAVAAEVRGIGRSAYAVPADLSKTEQAKDMMARALTGSGRLDALIYNAALEKPRRFLSISEDNWDLMLATNLKGYFMCAQALVGHWQAEKRSGAIVAISSTGGLVGFPNNADYCAAKAGMIGLTKAIALDCGALDIRANVVAPGCIESETMTRSAASGEEHARAIDLMRRFIPARRFASVQDIARAAVFLASEESAYINGDVLTVDGGMTLGAQPPMG